MTISREEIAEWVDRYLGINSVGVYPQPNPTQIAIKAIIVEAILNWDVSRQ